jgi:hypothetical protein
MGAGAAGGKPSPALTVALSRLRERQGTLTRALRDLSRKRERQDTLTRVLRDLSGKRER